MNQTENINLTMPEIVQEPIIYCQKCNSKNNPDAKKCNQCGVDLLPGAGFTQRLGVFFLMIFLALVSFGIGFLFFRVKPEFGGKDWIYLAGFILFGLFLFGLGIKTSFRKIPVYERFSARAKRHINLNPRQAVADYEAAINSAPLAEAFNYLLERANLFQKIGLEKEALLDWQLALKNINKRMANLSPPYLELTRQRAELYKNLGLQDEYSLEMLLYTIEKELNFKFKEGEIAEGFGEGLKKGTEDAKRKELQHIRLEILKNQKFKINGYCQRCKKVVDLDYTLKCSKDPKHKKITKIKPVLSMPTET